MRGFTKAHYESLNQRCTGMEFATEMIIKSSLRVVKISEVPITLHPDGRTLHPPHLKTFRDGWRTLRFFLMFCPRWLFLIPGVALMFAGVVGSGLVFARVTWHGAILDVHTLLYACAGILCGYQAILFAIFTKTFAIMEGMMPKDPRILRFFEVVNLERGLAVGFVMLVSGLALMLHVFLIWRGKDFGGLDYASTMRWAIPGSTLTALGFQTIMSGFFVSILGMNRKK
jgi:hypothetical protein